MDVTKGPKSNVKEGRPTKRSFVVSRNVTSDIGVSVRSGTRW